MSDIPEEIRKMFPDQPIHKLDIDDNGELHILASSEPLTEPDFENMPIERVNQYLREHGYDPEQVRVNGKILTDALIENINLHARAETAERELAALCEAVIVLRNMLRPGGGYSICHADNTPMYIFDHMVLDAAMDAIDALLPTPTEGE